MNGTKLATPYPIHPVFQETPVGPLTIHVSSTCYDLQSVRYAIKEQLETFHLHVLISEERDYTVDPISPMDVTPLKNVSSSDIVVLIVGRRFGSKYPGSNQISYTEREIIEARNNRIPVVCLVDTYVLEIKKSFDDGRLSVEDSDTLNLFAFIDRLRAQGYWLHRFPSQAGKESEIVDIIKEQLSRIFHLYLKKSPAILTEQDIMLYEQTVLQQIWVVSPHLFCDSHEFRDVVLGNLQRGIHYKYFVPPPLEDDTIYENMKHLLRYLIVEAEHTLSVTEARRGLSFHFCPVAPMEFFLYDPHTDNYRAFVTLTEGHPYFYLLLANPMQSSIRTRLYKTVASDRDFNWWEYVMRDMDGTSWLTYTDARG